MSRPLQIAVAVSALVAIEAAAMTPLDNKQEFTYGPFVVPDAPPDQGPVPARLQALPHDRSPLPAGVWLRFENFGAARYKGWSAQMQIDDAGSIFLVAHLGDACADKVAHPAWPKAPSQKLDPDTLAELRKSALAFAAGPPYRGHAGLPWAPTFVLTVRGDDGKVRELILEGFEDPFIAHLRRISYFALETPLAPARSAKRKPRAKRR